MLLVVAVRLEVRARERGLVWALGDDHVEYAGRTGRFLPRIGGRLR